MKDDCVFVLMCSEKCKKRKQTAVSMKLRMDLTTYVLIVPPPKKRPTTSSWHYTGASGSFAAVTMVTTPLWPSLVRLHFRARKHECGSHRAGTPVHMIYSLP